MGKRLRVSKSICSCASPRLTSSSLPPFSWLKLNSLLHEARENIYRFIFSDSISCRHDEDIWTEIAKHLDGKSLIMLAATSKWFLTTLMHDSVWKYACLRDLEVPDCYKTKFKWIKLYASAFDGSHSYAFRQKEKHIDWMRIGAFCFDSSDAFLMENLIRPTKFPREKKVQNMLNSCGSCVLHNIKTGIWIADLQLVRCPVCDQNTCDGTMQVLDARHLELFLSEGYLNGSWEYKLVGSHDIRKRMNTASGCILDIKNLKSRSTAELFNLKSWAGGPKDYLPKAVVTYHAVAINTNLQPNDGLQMKYHVMTAGDTDEVMSIRISQQLL